MPEAFQRCIHSYKATAPDVQNEGFNGYMETEVTFQVSDLEAFGTLWRDSMVYPSDRQRWYQMIKTGIDKFNEEI